MQHYHTQMNIIYIRNENTWGNGLSPYKARYSASAVWYVLAKSQRLISVLIFFAVKTNTWNQNTYTKLWCSPRRNWKWSWINSFLLLIQITTRWKCLQFDHEVGICHILDAASQRYRQYPLKFFFVKAHMCKVLLHALKTMMDIAISSW